MLLAVLVGLLLRYQSHADVVHRAVCRRLHPRTLLPKHRWHVNPRGGEHSSSAALLRRRRFDLIITCIGKS